MKLFNKNPIFIITAYSLLASNVVLAGDEQVNCREEIVDYKDIYAGVPECEASYDVTTCRPINPNLVEVTTETFTQTLTGGYRESESQFVSLSELITYQESNATPDGNGGAACTLPRSVSETIRCTAELDFLEQRPVRVEVCDYTPLTRPVDNGYGVVQAAASDRDGTIVRYEWWIDGVKQSETGSSITIEREAYLDTRVRDVQVRVTDDDGYTDSASVNATPYIPRSCNGRRC